MYKSQKYIFNIQLELFAKKYIFEYFSNQLCETMQMNLKNKTLTDEPILHLHISFQDSFRYDKFKASLRQKNLQVSVKRLFDIIVSLFLIVLLLPVFILITLLIILTSGSPVLYNNKRVGVGGNQFKCHKFRSMTFDHSRRNADHKAALERQQIGILHKRRHDTRITWIGGILRKTSLDEIPQLFNVLKGEMSLIGPRPLVPFMLKPYPEFARLRCLVKPGITGLWQIRDREHNTSAQFMLHHDLEYIEKFSLLLDAKILFETPLIVISGKGAY